MSTYVFISYVRDNSAAIDRICETLTAVGVEVWRDKDQIMPGMRWKDAIRQAIRQGAYFLACFSQAYWARTETFMNTELGFAVEELAKRRGDQSWFVPILLDDCEVPDKSIGAGESLRDLQYVDLRKDWPDGMRRILSALKPLAPEDLSQKAKHWVAEERRTDRALSLYDEWHSPLIHESRIQVSNLIELCKADGKPLPTLSAFEEAQRLSSPFSSYSDHTFRIVHFFEKWAFLYNEGLIDERLISRLLSSYVGWYQKELIHPLRTDESNPDFVRLLQMIDRLFGSVDSPAHTGDANQG